MRPKIKTTIVGLLIALGILAMFLYARIAVRGSAVAARAHEEHTDAERECAQALGKSSVRWDTEEVACAHLEALDQRVLWLSPQVRVEKSGVLHIVGLSGMGAAWGDEGIPLMHWHKEGREWHQERITPVDAGTILDFRAEFDHENSRLYVLWAERRGSAVLLYLRERSKDGWLEPVRVSDEPAKPSFFPGDLDLLLSGRDSLDAFWADWRGSLLLWDLLSGGHGQRLRIAHRKRVHGDWGAVSLLPSGHARVYCESPKGMLDGKGGTAVMYFQDRVGGRDAGVWRARLTGADWGEVQEVVACPVQPLTGGGTVRLGRKKEDDTAVFWRCAETDGGALRVLIDGWVCPQELRNVDVFVPMPCAGGVLYQRGDPQSVMRIEYSDVYEGWQPGDPLIENCVQGCFDVTASEGGDIYVAFVTYRGISTSLRVLSGKSESCRQE